MTPYTGHRGPLARPSTERDLPGTRATGGPAPRKEIVVVGTVLRKAQIIAIDLDLERCHEEWRRCRIEGLRDEAKQVLKRADALLDKRLAVRT